MWGVIVGALLCLGMTGTGWAQTPPATRAEALDAARIARERELTPEKRDPIERAIFFVEDHRIIERLNPAQGFYPTMGSVVRGSGAGLGLGYRTRPFSDRLLVDMSTSITYRNYRVAQGAVHLQRIGDKPLDLSVGGRWFDYTQDDYYGLGTTSLVSERVSFSQQGTDLYSQLTARKAGWFVTRGRLGVRRYDVGRGEDRGFPSVEERFTEATAPGLTQRTSLGYAEASFGVDTRDEPGNTRGGGLYNVTFGAHRDRGTTGFDFNRIDVKAMHVIPIFDKKRGIALHLAASRVDPVGDRLAPFFLMPTVGGADSLRGYREFRFRDRAALTLNGEYLWEATSALDLALFVDAADVGPSWKALVGARLKSSWGVGFRFNTNRRVFLRIDVARSHEGWRVWTALGPAFRVPAAVIRQHTAAVVALLALVATVRSATPTYYPDDPLSVDPEMRSATQVRERQLSDPYDFVENTFLNRGDHTNQRALNVNTIDEVPDSSWFTNRVGRQVLTVDDYVRGHHLSGPPAPGAWTVVSGKGSGISPGFTVRDSAGTVWFLKFDPPSNPEMATGAEVIATRLFWALGYNVPENYLAVLDPATLAVDPNATYRDELGQRRRLTRSMVAFFLEKGARRADGLFRVVASRALPGIPVGPFKDFGTRLDDPNDIFPHEHRRELRGLRGFAAWLNHDDSRSLNSLDTVVDVDGRALVRHHLIDFGSTLGSASVQAQKPRAGNEYIWEARPTLLTMLSFGFWVRPWIKVHYPAFPAIGRIEAAYFWPERWKPEYPNAAFDNARADDLFWAARRVMAVPDEAIRAVVGTAEFTEPGAANYLADVIIARRDKIGLQWLTGVNPLGDFVLDPAGTLTFTNIAVETRRSTPPGGYEIVWGRFDNATGQSTTIDPPMSVTEPRAAAPADVLDGEFVEAAIHTRHPSYPAWRRPVIAHFRRQAAGWTLVGLRRDGLD